MDWQDSAVVLTARRHGEHAGIVTLLARDHGRYAGLVRSLRGARSRGIFEPGNLVAASWRARLDEHLGTLTGELAVGYAVRVMDDPDALACAAAACALLEAVLPERLPAPALFDSLVALLDSLATADLTARYVRWEVGVLAELGFGLDLARCAVTGADTGLAYVSPRTGRAVSAAAAAPYAARLLPLPTFLVDAGAPAPAPSDLLDGLRLTGFFLATHVLADRRLPPARDRLLDRLARAAKASP